jgi:hypothetical protein
MKKRFKKNPKDMRSLPSWPCHLPKDSPPDTLRQTQILIYEFGETHPACNSYLYDFGCLKVFFFSVKCMFQECTFRIPANVSCT